MGVYGPVAGGIDRTAQELLGDFRALRLEDNHAKIIEDIGDNLGVASKHDLIAVTDGIEIVYPLLISMSVEFSRTSGSNVPQESILNRLVDCAASVGFLTLHARGSTGE
jgi:hypothetical protein